MYVCMYARRYVYVCMHVGMYMYVFMYMYICVCMYDIVNAIARRSLC